MSGAHRAFEGAGSEPGLLIWRIENFDAVPYPTKDYGKFYSGDSYIVLFTKKNKTSFTWDIHFWLGSETSQDEAGAAAIMAVELDDSLGGIPVQHREVQDHESQLFLSYFKSGIRYLPGGVASGFHHVDPDAVEKKLFQVKGKRNVRVRQVNLHASSMNKGDCFILDAGKEIFVYVGKNSKRTERLKAISAANQIRDQDHAGRAHILIIDEYSDQAEASFFEALGSGSPDEVADETGEDDAEFEKKQETVVTLYHVSDASGEMIMDKVGEKPLHQDMLNSTEHGGQDCYILDTVTSGIFVWIGKQCTKDEKLEAMKLAEKFLVTNTYPVWTKIQRIVEGGEPSTFKQYFSGWRETQDQIGLGRVFALEQIAANIPEQEFDPSSLHAGELHSLAKSGCKAVGFMPDDGSGAFKRFYVENLELVPVNHTFFFGGDSYVIKYTYEKNGHENCIIYFWQGQDSTPDEKAESEIHAFRLASELGGKAIQVRVTQGNEPHHLLRIFQGSMVVFLGGKASGFHNSDGHDTCDDSPRLFQVRGTNHNNMKTVQVPEVASSLNSDYVFILKDQKVTTPENSDYESNVWVGKGTSAEEKEMALKAVNYVAPGLPIRIINEGEESAKFWNVLGGEGEYKSGYDGQGTPLLVPRLFHYHVSPAAKLRVEEISHFKQEDLDEDDIMVLDSRDEIYVWVGNKASQDERQLSMKMAEEYLKSDPTDRSHELTLIFIVKQGDEPASFTSLFPSWDPSLWESLPSYEDVKNRVAAGNAAI